MLDPDPPGPGPDSVDNSLFIFELLIRAFLVPMLQMDPNPPQNTCFGAILIM
jgi:hypothetical protein